MVILIINIILHAIIGLCIGSFVYVFYCRFKPQQSVRYLLYDITFSRSTCPHCQHKLAIWQLIPILSWLLLKGRCYYCHTSVSFFYLIIELVIGGLFIFIMTVSHIHLNTLLLFLLGCWFTLLTLIDIKYYLLPDFLTQPLLWLGLLLAFLQLSILTLEQAFMGAILGYILLWLPANLFYLCTKKTGLGGGDIKLFAALGAWVDYQYLPLLLVCATVIGGICFIMYNLIYKNPIKVIPFGPCLLAPIYLYLCYFMLYSEQANSI